jgi:iduronate 2-sulfatase
MSQEGASHWEKAERVENMLKLSSEAYTEMMWGYAASITFVDEQVGRLLDAVDRLQLWDNLTIVLTSDHGMHNGEKGTWVSCS